MLATSIHKLFVHSFSVTEQITAFQILAKDWKRTIHTVRCILCIDILMKKDRTQCSESEKTRLNDIMNNIPKRIVLWACETFQWMFVLCHCHFRGHWIRIIWQPSVSVLWPCFVFRCGCDRESYWHLVLFELDCCAGFLFCWSCITVLYLVFSHLFLFHDQWSDQDGGKPIGTVLLAWLSDGSSG